MHEQSSHTGQIKLSRLRIRVDETSDGDQTPVSGLAHIQHPGTPHGTRPSIITNQITDHYAPYCDELGYAVCNDIRVLPD
jgi:hypothetical protein